MARFSANNYILANVNELIILDIRKMSFRKEAIYEGERISKLLALSKESMIVGNRDKTMQIWQFYWLLYINVVGMEGC